MSKAKGRGFKTAMLVLVLLVAVVGSRMWFSLFREIDTYYESDLDHFKYGSVGVEAANGIPYWVWRVLPRVCSDELPGTDGYKSFGFIWEEGREAPIGLPVKTVGFRRIGINCALCHTGTVRTSPADTLQLIVGAPSTTLDLQRYLRFLFACASSPQFTADKILAEIQTRHRLSFLERLLHRSLIIPQTKKALLKQKAQLAWMDEGPDWGPGRQDPFNPAKGQILRLPPDGSIGNADILPLWNRAPREGFALHWDGLNTSLTEIFLNSGIGNGASNKTIDIKSLKRIQTWIQKRPPPKYPFTINPQLTAKGHEIFNTHCATCHAFGGALTGKVLKLDRLGTDRYRLASWSQATADAFNSLDIYAWQYSHFQATYGYAAVPLDGIWARAPYLHNGSVPSLWDLLAPPNKRPRDFYRGCDVYDPQKVGFVSTGQEAEKTGFLFDTNLPGNGNDGHLWGTDLTEDDKLTLIEYLKTL